MSRSLSEKEIEAAKGVFDVFDKKGDGKIDVADIGNVIRALDKNPLESEVKKAQKNLDPTDSGKRVSFTEFAPILTSLHNAPGSVDDFVNGLRVFDKDGTGFMPTSELRHVLTSLGEKLTTRQVDQLIAGVPVDVDGNINYDAFVRKIMYATDK
eukprot:Awhi_evm1s1242